MLNTDQHNPAIKKENKMTLDQFVRNTSAIPGIDQVPRSYLNPYNNRKEWKRRLKDECIDCRRTLESLYSAIVRDEIHIDTEGSVFSNIEKKVQINVYYYTFVRC